MRIQITLLISILLISTVNCTAQKTSAENISKIATLENPRAAHTATRLLDGNVLIVGGMHKNGVFFDEAEIFDIDKNLFITVKNKMTKRRVSHTATLLKDGRVLIVGGWSNRRAPETSAETYDPKTKSFASVGKTKFARSGHSSTLLENGKVLIAGGYNGDRNLSEAELFDPRTNRFEAIENMQVTRNVHSATTLNDGRVLLTGGEMSRGNVIADAEIFSPKTNKFTKVYTKMNFARYKHDSVLLSDGNVLIFGGSDERDRGGKLKSAEIFDPAKQTFTRIRDMHFPRFKISQTATLLPNGKVLIAGGSKRAEVFDPETNSFKMVSGTLEKSLHYSTVTLLRDGRALILGGYEFIRGGEPTSTKQAWVFKI